MSGNSAGRSLKGGEVKLWAWQYIRLDSRKGCSGSSNHKTGDIFIAMTLSTASEECPRTVGRIHTRRMSAGLPSVGETVKTGVTQMIIYKDIYCMSTVLFHSINSVSELFSRVGLCVCFSFQD